MIDYISYIHFIILGIVQGITELLPISSSAHLIISNIILKSNYGENLFLTSLHLGTTLSIFIYFFKDIIYFCTKRNLIILLIISSIPAVIVGVFLNDIIELYLRSPYIIVFTLIIVGVLMIFTQRKYKEKNTINNLEYITIKDAILIGFAQSLALIPGVSRSGITTLTGIHRGISKETALKFSFIIGLPILFGSFLYEFLQTENALNIILQPQVILGIFTSTVFGYLSIFILKRYLIKNFLEIFGYYRIILGVVILMLLLIHYI